MRLQPNRCKQEGNYEERKIYRYGYDLQRLLQPCGKSGEQAGGNWKSQREPADQFHAGGI